MSRRIVTLTVLIALAATPAVLRVTTAPVEAAAVERSTSTRPR
jgi:hypothetical protein